MDIENSLVITMSGKFGSGKDTVAELLKEEFSKKDVNVFVLAYADYLKSLCARNFGFDGNKEEKRFILQNFGDFMRLTDPNFFVSTVWRTIDTLKNNVDVFIITDCRYENEMRPYPWRLSYPIFNLYVDRQVEDSNDRKHVSESMANNPDNYLFDYKIDNNATLEETKNEVALFVERVLNTYKDQLKEQRGLDVDAQQLIDDISKEIENEASKNKLQ